MTRCKKCGKPKNNNAELCLSCHQNKVRSENAKYGRKICAKCGKTIVGSYRYCYECNRKINL